MMVLGKTLGGGILPVSAVIMKEQVAMSIEPGARPAPSMAIPWGPPWPPR